MAARDTDTHTTLRLAHSRTRTQSHMHMLTWSNTAWLAFCGLLAHVAKLPDSMMTLVKSPRDAGMTRWLLMEPAPADSPKMVTREGSPPKAATLRCTQRIAARWSCTPLLPVLPRACVCVGCVCACVRGVCVRQHDMAWWLWHARWTRVRVSVSGVEGCRSGGDGGRDQKRSKGRQ
jgi:hypothetical protein